jgi:predicted nucleic acid-binding Zn ribbon protein
MLLLRSYNEEGRSNESIQKGSWRECGEIIMSETDMALATILIILLVTTLLILIVPYVLYPDMIQDNVRKHINDTVPTETRALP